VSLALLVALCLASPPTVESPAPYAGQETRPVKALSAEDIAAYLAGEGMGLARAAELNHHPGPRHVLDLREKLGLSAEQEVAVRKAFDDMHAEAKRLGAQVVEAERALDARFAAAGLDAAELDRRVAEIAALQGKLRAAHLRAHLVTRAALTAEQIARYDALRGYGHHTGAHAHH
jgi:Spy/CpxP family protein refolding chaperone